MSYLVRQHKYHYQFPHGIEYIDKFEGAHLGLVTALAQTVWITTGLLIELLAIRFMIAFLGANPGNALFHFIYVTSQPLVNPFLNVIHQTFPAGHFYRFEAYTLVAIAFYALIGYGLAKILTSSEPQLPSDD